MNTDEGCDQTPVTSVRSSQPQRPGTKESNRPVSLTCAMGHPHVFWAYRTDGSTECFKSESESSLDKLFYATFCHSFWPCFCHSKKALKIVFAHLNKRRNWHPLMVLISEGLEGAVRMAQ